MNIYYKILIGVVAIILISGGLTKLYYSLPKTPEVETIETTPVTPEKIIESIPELATTTVAIATFTPTTTQTNLITKKNAISMVKIITNKGEITLELFPTDAPKTVENFLTLVKKGFYDGVIFHRVISGFMIQGGDPTGTGSGGPGYQFEDELNPSTDSYKRGYVRGVLAMANSGPNTNGSQFFILHANYPLPHNYTIFGRVINGIETVDAIAESEVDFSDRPVEEIIMTKVEILK